MKKILTQLFAVSTLAMACSAFAAGPLTPVQGAPGAATAPSVSQYMSDLKAKLKINGSDQEKAWQGFVAASENKVDITTFQEMTRAKTAPELMNSLEKMQTQAAKRFGEQKKVIVGLYDVLNEEQRKTFDTFVFGAMARMGAAPAAR